MKPMTDAPKPDTPAAPSSKTPGEPGTPDRPMPAAGPHAKPELTNSDATPGAGTLADAEDETMDDVSS
jgi:hypothetical protein